MSLSRRIVAEAVGTALLLAAVVGSGIMGERLAGGNIALTLLANAFATGAALTALIHAFGPVSGAHFNPVVTLALATRNALSWKQAGGYVLAQLAGAFAGAAVAHLMFGEAVFSASGHARSGPGQWLSEGIATFGLLAIVLGCVRHRPAAVPYSVGAYIAAAYWFTASTAFVNPAVTLARAASDTFAGIRPADAPGFVLAQLVGAASAILLWRWLDASGAAGNRPDPAETP